MSASVKPGLFLAAALKYGRLGWPELPLEVAGKKPDGLLAPHGSADATTDEQRIRQWWSTRPEANIGLLMGVDRWALDVDPRHDGDGSLDELIHRYGPLPDTAQQITGSGGRHFIFRMPDFQVYSSHGVVGKGLDIVGKGNYIVGAPSVHPLTGLQYSWDGLKPLEKQPIADAPEWLLSLVKRPEAAAAAAGGGAREEWPKGDVDLILARCPWMRHCRDEEALLEEPEWYALLGVLGRCKGGHALVHEWSRQSSKYDRARTAAKLKHALVSAGPATCATIQTVWGGAQHCAGCVEEVKSPAVLAIRRVGPIPLGPEPPLQAAAKSSMPATVSEPGGSKEWRSELIRCKPTKDGSGEPKALLANAIVALRRAPEWDGVLSFNEFTLSTVTQRAPVFGGAAGAEWTDHEDRLFADWLQHHEILVPVEIAGQAVQAVARDRTFHPVRDYLDGLKWDGAQRIDGWGSLYLGVEPTPYTSAVAARFLIGAVARVINPGCKLDCAFILEGEQGIKKSTALRTMAEPWFSDELCELGSKDASLQTMGVWVIELSELEVLTRGEVGKIKAFMSRSIDRFRPPYGRHLIESPRQCVFAGSVNRATYLRDESGGRRFWPVRCGKIRIRELARDRDQLWAEAVVRYRAGAPWWLDTADLNRQAEDEQSCRFEASAWDDLILTWLAERLGAGDPSVSVGEILAGCLQKRVSDWMHSDQMRVASCLVRAKWTRYRDRKMGMQWRYRPPVPR
jgi:predicted P-loop ATPase